MKYNNTFYKLQYFLKRHRNPILKMSERNISYFPPSIISETSSVYRLRILLPNYSLEDFSLSIKDNHLLLKGGICNKTRIKHKDENDKKIYSSFVRMYSFNYCVEKESVVAQLQDGMLFIELRKTDSERIEIIANELVDSEYIDNNTLKIKKI